jgi:hypothetical protein
VEHLSGTPSKGTLLVLLANIDHAERLSREKHSSLFILFVGNELEVFNEK